MDIQSESQAITDRIKERLAEPLMFAFFVSFCTFNWKFVYLLWRGDQKTTRTLEWASNELSCWSIVVPAVMAGLYVAALPMINAYIAQWHAKWATKRRNLQLEEQANNKYSVAMLRDLPLYKDVTAQQQALMRHIAVLMNRLYPRETTNEKSPFAVYIDSHHEVREHSFAQAYGESTPYNVASMQLRASTGFRVYIVERLELSLDLVVGATQGALVPWPPGFEKDTLYADSSGRLTETEPKPPVGPMLQRVGDKGKVVG